MLLDCRLAAWSAALSSCCALVFMIAAAWQNPARAQGKLEASYVITFARISVGDATRTAEWTENADAVAMTVLAGGIIRRLANGEFSWTTRGNVKAGRPEPRNFT